jgi:hypothetical protein
MHKHHDLRAIGTLRVDHAQVIRVGDESSAFYCSAYVRVSEGNDFDTAVKSHKNTQNDKLNNKIIVTF